MEHRRFDSDRYYRPTDPEMAIFGAVSTLAQWRHAGAGPDFVRFGNRILYRGDALNEFLDAHTVTYTNEEGSDVDKSGSEGRDRAVRPGGPEAVLQASGPTVNLA